MRLIDADALIERTRAHGERIAYVESFVQDINEAPTVAMGDNHITIKWTPDIDRLARDVAYQGLNDFSFMGKSIREWAEIILEQTAMQWISVKDRLPETNGYYITYDHNAGLIDELYYNDRYQAFNTQFRADTAIPVTHWMPLPEPPEEEENGRA